MPDVHNPPCFTYKCGAWCFWAHTVHNDFRTAPGRPKCTRRWQVRMIVRNLYNVNQ